MPTKLLRVEQLAVQLPVDHTHVHAVDTVDLTLKEGEVLCLVGESGSGKTVTALSLLRLLDQAEYAEKSRMILDETDLLCQSDIQLRSLRGKKIAIIFQEPMTSLNPVKTIGQQLRAVAAKERCYELLACVGLSEPKVVFERYPHQLSGGMRQRVMIAMALAGDPEVLIADEPTTALDVTTQAQILTLLQDLAASRAMGMIFITHDLGIVSKMADTVAVMYAGHIVEQAPRDEFFKQPKHPYSQRLLACLPSVKATGSALPMIPGFLPNMKKFIPGCRFSPRCEYSWDRCRETLPELTEFKGAQVRCHLYTTPGKSLPCVSQAEGLSSGFHHEQHAQAPILEVKDLQIHYPIKKGIIKRTVGYVKAVDGISFELEKGKTLGIVGESGSGKTSVAFALVRLLNEARGEINFQGKNILSLSPRAFRPMRRSIQMIFQDPMGSLDPRMTVREILTEGLAGQGINLVDLLGSVGLSEDALNRYPHEFSGGQHQRIAIARALSTEPEILVCDEPTSALDVSVQAQIINLLRTLQEEKNLSYIFISHNIPVVSYLAHHIAVMHRGKIVEYGTTREVIENPQHPYTRALLAAVPQL